jgi:hypothetical protein
MEASSAKGGIAWGSHARAWFCYTCRQPDPFVAKGEHPVPEWLLITFLARCVLLHTSWCLQAFKKGGSSHLAHSVDTLGRRDSLSRSVISVIDKSFHHIRQDLPCTPQGKLGFRKDCIYRHKCDNASLHFSPSLRRGANHDVKPALAVGHTSFASHKMLPSNMPSHSRDASPGSAGTHFAWGGPMSSTHPMHTMAFGPHDRERHSGKAHLRDSCKTPQHVSNGWTKHSSWKVTPAHNHNSPTIGRWSLMLPPSGSESLHRGLRDLHPAHVPPPATAAPQNSVPMPASAAIVPPSTAPAAPSSRALDRRALPDVAKVQSTPRGAGSQRIQSDNVDLDRSPFQNIVTEAATLEVASPGKAVDANDCVREVTFRSAGNLLITDDTLAAPPVQAVVTSPEDAKAQDVNRTPSHPLPSDTLDTVDSPQHPWNTPALSSHPCMDASYQCSDSSASPTLSPLPTSIITAKGTENKTHASQALVPEQTPLSFPASPPMESTSIQHDASEPSDVDHVPAPAIAHTAQPNSLQVPEEPHQSLAGPGGAAITSGTPDGSGRQNTSSSSGISLVASPGGPGRASGSAQQSITQELITDISRAPCDLPAAVRRISSTQSEAHSTKQPPRAEAIISASSHQGSAAQPREWPSHCDRGDDESWCSVDVDQLPSDDSSIADVSAGGSVASGDDFASTLEDFCTVGHTGTPGLSVRSQRSELSHRSGSLLSQRSAGESRAASAVGRSVPGEPLQQQPSGLYSTAVVAGRLGQSGAGAALELSGSGGMASDYGQDLRYSMDSQAVASGHINDQIVDGRRLLGQKYSVDKVVGEVGLAELFP